MNKAIINWRQMLAVAVVCALVIITAQAAVQPYERIDGFDSSVLSAFWTLDTDPVSGGIWTHGDSGGNGYWVANGVGNEAYSHIQTTNTFDTTNGIRADMIALNGVYPTVGWAMGIAIYYDNNNWVSLRQTWAGGSDGWLAQVVSDGEYIKSAYGNLGSTTGGWWLMSGIEITSDRIKFLTSTPGVHQFGVSDLDSQMSEITSLGLDRPAGFTGLAKVIIGTGASAPGSGGLDFDNSGSSATSGSIQLDYVRIQASIVTPDVCGDPGTVYLPMDFDGNCYVDFADFAEFVSYWLDS